MIKFICFQSIQKAITSISVSDKCDIGAISLKMAYLISSVYPRMQPVGEKGLDNK